MILTNISKLQQDLQLRTFDDVPNSTSKTSTSSQSEENLIQGMPLISSFFPFTRNTTDNNDLTDILTQSNELLTEGSIFDGLSVQQGQYWEIMNKRIARRINGGNLTMITILF